MPEQGHIETLLEEQTVTAALVTPMVDVQQDARSVFALTGTMQGTVGVELSVDGVVWIPADTDLDNAAMYVTLQAYAGVPRALLLKQGSATDTYREPYRFARFRVAAVTVPGTLRVLYGGA